MVLNQKYYSDRFGVVILEKKMIMSVQTRKSFRQYSASEELKLLVPKPVKPNWIFYELYLAWNNYRMLLLRFSTLSKIYIFIYAKYYFESQFQRKLPTTLSIIPQFLSIYMITKAIAFVLSNRFSFKPQSAGKFKYLILKIFCHNTLIVSHPIMPFRERFASRNIELLRQNVFENLIRKLPDRLQFIWGPTRWYKKLCRMCTYKNFQYWVRMGKVVCNIRVNSLPI